MVQVALTTFALSILGLAFLIARRLPDIAVIPVELTSKHSGKISFAARTTGLMIRFWWDALVFGKRIGFWIFHFSLEKTLRKVRIIALKVENFSARKLEDMRTHSHDIPHFSFFEDLTNRSDKK